MSKSRPIVRTVVVAGIGLLASPKTRRALNDHWDQKARDRALAAGPGHVQPDPDWRDPRDLVVFSIFVVLIMGVNIFYGCVEAARWLARLSRIGAAA